MAKPGRRCTVCESDERSRADWMLARRVPAARIARKLGLSPSALARHGRLHLPPAIKAALAFEVPEAELDLAKLRDSESEKLLGRIVHHHARILALVNQAEEDGDYHAAARLWRTLITAWEAEAKLLGELGSSHGHTTNILINPTFVELCSDLMGALRPYPAARKAVAEVMDRVNGKALVELEGQAHATP